MEDQWKLVECSVSGTHLYHHVLLQLMYLDISRSKLLHLLFIRIPEFI